MKAIKILSSKYHDGFALVYQSDFSDCVFVEFLFQDQYCFQVFKLILMCKLKRFYVSKPLHLDPIEGEVYFEDVTLPTQTFKEPN